MPITVKREDLLQQLLSVQPGLSTRDIIEQSSCFVFKDGEVVTFNGEISCRHRTTLETISGAVQAQQLVAVLQKMVEEEVEVDTGDGHFLIYGKKRRAGIRMEQEVILPYDKVSLPSSWRKLPEDFKDAVAITKECAGRDQSNFQFTCVHIAEKWIEACDNVQLARYNIETGVEKPILVRAKSISDIIQFDITKFGETDEWLHFKGPGGLILSCRRHIENFPSLDSFLDVHGQETSLPKGLADAADKAEIFSSEQDKNEVLVEISPGKVRVRGQSVSGWYSETKNMNYEGPPLKFYLSPQLLAELVRRHDKCEIKEDRLKVDGGKFRYVTCLGKVESQNGQED